jgi:cobalt-precorrin 5A hydrolase
VKIAVISVTLKGALLGERLRQTMAMPVDLYSRVRGGLPEETNPFDNLSELVGTIFSQYEGLVFIMATGIVVRVVAPHIKDKRSDPAVVVMDDAGIHAISLLAGHIGGANELTGKVAAAVGARPVITTATDVAHLPAPDVLAVKMELAIEPFEDLKSVNAAIVAGERVPFFLDQDLALAPKYMRIATEMGVELLDMQQLQDGSYDAAVVITDKELYLPQLHIYLRPPTLSIGIGCRKGVTSSQIGNAIKEACRKIGRSRHSIAIMGSSVVKQEEIGLLATAQQMELPMQFYSNEELQEIIDVYRLDISKFVQDEIGVGNVCEAAALLGGRASSLLLPKTVYPKVTVAIAEVKFRWWESDPAMA